MQRRKKRITVDVLQTRFGTITKGTRLAEKLPRIVEVYDILQRENIGHAYTILGAWGHVANPGLCYMIAARKEAPDLYEKLISSKINGLQFVDEMKNRRRVQNVQKYIRVPKVSCRILEEMYEDELPKIRRLGCGRRAVRAFEIYRELMASKTSVNGKTREVVCSITGTNHMHFDYVKKAWDEDRQSYERIRAGVLSPSGYFRKRNGLPEQSDREKQIVDRKRIEFASTVQAVDGICSGIQMLTLDDHTIGCSTEELKRMTEMINSSVRTLRQLSSAIRERISLRHGTTTAECSSQENRSS